MEARDEKFIAERFAKNLAFFDATNPKLARALQTQNARYKLVFNQSDINILDSDSRALLFPKNSFINTALQIAQNPLNNELWRVFSNNLSLSKIESKNLVLTSRAINDIIDLALKNIFLDSKISQDSDFSRDLMNLVSNYHLPSAFLPQTNIFGLAGGLFLQILLELNFKFHALLICEESIELFAISCYFVDFKRVFAQSNSCHIFIENIANKAFLNHYFYTKRITNNFLRLEIAPLNAPNIIKMKQMVRESYKANARGWGSFEDEMIGVLNTLKNIKKSKVLALPNKINMPICVVGSGASLEYNLEFLKKNQDRMLIFSAGTALKVLKKENINIDFQIEMERIPYLADILSESSLNETPVFCANVVDNRVLELAKESYIFVRGGASSSYMFENIDALEFCAPFVGNAGFALACNMSDEIILCGIDCGYIKNHAKHAKNSFYGNEEIEIPRDCFEVEGNADCEVFSNAIFSLSKENLRQAILLYKPKKVYNLSRGAKIPLTISARELNLKKVDKSALKASWLKTHENIELKNLEINLDSMLNKLKVEVKTKQELFQFIDEINAFLIAQARENPYQAILLEGSVSHILQNILIAILCVKSNDINAIFCAMREVLYEFIENIKKEYNKKVF